VVENGRESLSESDLRGLDTLGYLFSRAPVSPLTHMLDTQIVRGRGNWSIDR